MNSKNFPSPFALVSLDVEDFGLVAAAWFARVRKVSPRPEPVSSKGVRS